MEVLSRFPNIPWLLVFFISVADGRVTEAASVTQQIDICSPNYNGRLVYIDPKRITTIGAYDVQFHPAVINWSSLLITG